MNPHRSAWLSICFHNPHKQHCPTSQTANTQHTHAHTQTNIIIFLHTNVTLKKPLKDKTCMRMFVCMCVWVRYRGKVSLRSAPEPIWSAAGKRLETHPLTLLVHARAHTLKSNLNYMQVHLSHQTSSHHFAHVARMKRFLIPQPQSTWWRFAATQHTPGTVTERGR